MTKNSLENFLSLKQGVKGGNNQKKIQTRVIYLTCKMAIKIVFKFHINIPCGYWKKCIKRNTPKNLKVNFISTKGDIIRKRNQSRVIYLIFMMAIKIVLRFHVNIPCSYWNICVNRNSPKNFNANFISAKGGIKRGHNQ